jgi:hypothetical protein
MNRGKEPLDLGPWQRCERKDAAGIVLVSPYLKGQLVRDERGDHIFKGRWSISFEQFEPGPGPMSDFELRHKSADPHEADVSGRALVPGAVVCVWWGGAPDPMLLGCSPLSN